MGVRKPSSQGPQRTAPARRAPLHCGTPTLRGRTLRERKHCVSCFPKYRAVSSQVEVTGHRCVCPVGFPRLGPEAPYAMDPAAMERRARCPLSDHLPLSSHRWPARGTVQPGFSSCKREGPESGLQRPVQQASKWWLFSKGNKP